LTLRAWLRFSRIHTAAITMPSALLGYLIAGGPLLSWGSVEWLAFGLVFHWAGFIDNNIQDYRYDVKDSAKDMFPLGKEVSFPSAQRFALALHLIGITYAVILARSTMALFVFGSMYAFGLLYNRTNKTSPFAGIWIALCFGPIGLFSYYATVGSNPTPLVLALTAFGLLQVYFQNAVSGSMKDIDSDDYNIFKVMGVRVGNDVKVPPGGGHAVKTPKLMVTDRARVFAHLVKMAGAVPLGVLIFLSGTEVPVVLASAVLFLGAGVMTGMMMSDQPWDNRKTVRRAAVIEIFTFYSGVLALAGAIGYGSVAFVIVFSLAWFVGLNRLTWGTSLTPRV
jgi:4-hydroxybenzoate polyprenyltransferase